MPVSECPSWCTVFCPPILLRHCSYSSCIIRRFVMRQRHLQAAVDRVNQTARSPPYPRELARAVQHAVKDFNAQVVLIPDYMHFHSSHVLEALQALERIVKDLILHAGRSPLDPEKPMRIKARRLREKFHEIHVAWQATFLLGFKEQVVEFEKHLVFRGLFEDPAAAEDYLEQCYQRLETTLKDARRRQEVSRNSLERRRAAERSQRASVLANIELDRERHRHRAVYRAQAAVPAASGDIL